MTMRWRRRSPSTGPADWVRAGARWRRRSTSNTLVTDLRTGEIALVDCVTFWLTNQILDDADIEEEVDVLLARSAP
jgi:adenosyl cobinamide kinase/adenosyl cobinamide phosphate guanylyltransferase